MSASRVSKVKSIFKHGLFKNKVAIVTGGGTGIGMGITRELLDLGCKVMIASRNAERLGASRKILEAEIEKTSGAEIDHMECNIRKEDNVKRLIENTVSRYGQLDYLVNNGGGQFQCPAADVRLKGWNAVIETNLTGTFLCCREAYNQYMCEHGGAIVNIIVDLWKGFPSMSPSGAARAGVHNLTKSLAIEWAENGVRINCVAPGSSIYSETAEANYPGANIFQGVIPYVPAKRLGTVEEVSAAVCFLLSPASAFTTGDTIKVDGGSNLYSSMWPVSEHNKSKAFKWEDETEPKSTSKL